MFKRKGAKRLIITLTAGTFFSACLFCACNAHSHALEYFPASEATCTENGNTAHYKCSCGKCFSDEDAENEISAQSVIIPRKSHTFSKHGYDGEVHYLKCAVCGYGDVKSSAEHILKYAADDAEHYRYCLVCGYETERQAHVPEDGEDGDRFCSVCRFRRPKYELSADGTYYICSATSQAFKDGVTEIVSPDEYEGLPVKEVGERAFDGCKQLERVTLGKNVISVGGYAFKECVKLTEINLNDGLKEIGYSAFYCCTSLESIALPDGLIRLDNAVFHGCKALIQVNIPEAITALGSHLFYGCEALESFEIPEHVTSVETAAFCESGLKNFVVRDGLAAIPQTMFNKCPNLKTVTVPASVTSIGAGAFMNCPSLETVYYKGTFADWEKISFGNVWNNKSAFDLVCTDKVVRYSDGAIAE